MGLEGIGGQGGVVGTTTSHSSSSNSNEQTTANTKTTTSMIKPVPSARDAIMKLHLESKKCDAILQVFQPTTYKQKQIRVAATLRNSWK